MNTVICINKYITDIENQVNNIHLKIIKSPRQFVIIKSIQLLGMIFLSRKLNENIKIELVIFSMTIFSDLIRLKYIKSKAKEIMEKEVEALVKIIRENIAYNSISYDLKNYIIKVKTKEKEVNYYLETDRYDFTEDVKIDRKKMKESILKEFKKPNKKEVIIKKWQQVIKLVMK
ncbi:MAG: hypothetical protein ACRCW9_06120 [Cetobacterium sp.]